MIPWWKSAVRPWLAGVLGGLVGFERERLDKPGAFARTCWRASGRHSVRWV